MARILFFPSGNTFSHLLDGVSIGHELMRAGNHEVHFGVAARHSFFFKEKGLPCSVVPELWEKYGSTYPNTSWFIDRDYVYHCVKREIDLIKEIGPDLVVADFKYTTAISAKACGCRLASINILSMLPISSGNTFGFLADENSPEKERQKKFLHFFNRFAVTSMNIIAKRFGLPEKNLLSEYLTAEHVLVPDVPFFHFQEQETLPSFLQVIPPRGYPHKNSSKRQFSLSNEMPPNGRTVYVSLGSDGRNGAVLPDLVRKLSDGPWKLLVSTSGCNQALLNRIQAAVPRARVLAYVDLNREIKVHHENIAAYVCHGGLGSIFEAIRYELPLLIIPLQPEQEHNGRLVEAHGIGRRIWGSKAFTGNGDFYYHRLRQTPAASIGKQLISLLLDKKIRSNLQCINNRINSMFQDMPRARFRINGFLSKLGASSYDWQGLAGNKQQEGLL